MKRSWFKFIIVSYLFLYLLDGTLSITHNVVTVLYRDIKLLEILRNLIAFTVVAFSLPVIFFYSLSNVPKKTPLFLLPLSLLILDLFLPIIAKTQSLYLGIDHLFFNRSYDTHEFYINHLDALFAALIPSAIQLILGIYTWRWFKKNNDILNNNIQLHWLKKASL